MGKELHAPLGQTGKPESGRDWRIVFQFLSARLFISFVAKWGLRQTPTNACFQAEDLMGTKELHQLNNQSMVAETKRSQQENPHPSPQSLDCLVTSRAKP